MTSPLINESLAERFNTGEEILNDEDSKVALVRLGQSWQSMAAVSRRLGMVDQTLFNWVKASWGGWLTGVGSKPVSSEQMEISRLRAELARLKMERGI